MIANFKLLRKFHALLVMLISTIFYITIHLAFFIDIPYIPSLLLFKLPAFLVASFVSIYLFFTLRNIRIRNKILRKHRVD